VNNSEDKIQLKNQKEANSLRERLVADQGGRCPISGWEITAGSSHLDHDHQTGICRAALHPAVNRALSQDSMRRYGIPYNEQARVLRAMADYLDSYPATQYIHHTAKPKEKIIKKSNYAALGKRIKQATGKLPSWWGYTESKPTKRRSNPKAYQKLTKRLGALYEKYNLSPEYYAMDK